MLERDYFFESIETANFSIYAHLMNIKTNFVLIRNNFDRTLKMIKNFKFDRFSKSDYTNAFQIDIEIFDLILKTSKLEHQNL